MKPEKLNLKKLRRKNKSRSQRKVVPSRKRERQGRERQEKSKWRTGTRRRKEILRNLRKKPQNGAGAGGAGGGTGRRRQPGEALSPARFGGIRGVLGGGGAFVVAGAVAVAPTPPFFYKNPKKWGKIPPNPTPASPGSGCSAP